MIEVKTWLAYRVGGLLLFLLLLLALLMPSSTAKIWLVPPVKVQHAVLPVPRASNWKGGAIFWPLVAPAREVASSDHNVDHAGTSVHAAARRPGAWHAVLRPA